MNNNTFAVLIDIVSIQEYIFGSNKLKENIGASFLVEEVYRSYLENAIKETLPSYDLNDFNKWENDSDTIKINDKGVMFEVGYIGGGNALLLFKNCEDSKKFIKNWTRLLLVETPGLKTAVAIDQFGLDDFENEIKKLFNKLKDNKASYVPQTVIPRHGITDECSRTGYSIDVWNKEVYGFVSSVSNAKIIAEGKATNQLEDYFLENTQKKEYCFINDIEKLGQAKGQKNYIAIVHIDGNDIGEKFQDSNSLPAIRKLSKNVKKATDGSIKGLLGNIFNDYDKILDALGIDGNEYKEKARKIIPIRPVIIGGDDITFVCDGRMGIYFAKKFMEYFESKKVNGENLSTCAGVAVTKTKYPFYRGYLLAEQLCKAAKDFRKGKEINGKKIDDKNEGSWIDFHISSGGFSGIITEIRDSCYNPQQGQLINRPYKININDKDDSGFDRLVENTKKLKKTLANTKIKDMRNLMTMGSEEIRKFLNHIQAQGAGLPQMNYGSVHEAIFENMRTPYFDMIELMEFYPSFELE